MEEKKEIEKKKELFDINSLKTDEKKETEGVWFDYESGLRVKVARSNNTKYQAYMQKKYPRQLELIIKGKLVGIDANKVLADGMSRYILTDWQNMGEGGKPIPYSQEKAFEYLLIKDFRKEIMEFAEQTEQYAIENKEKAGKNL